MSDGATMAVVMTLLAFAGALIWYLISRIPRRHFGSLNPSEEDVSQGLDKAEDAVRQCYTNLDSATAQQIAATKLESMKETSRGFIRANKALNRALKARNQARGWAYSRGFDRAVARHIKNSSGIRNEHATPEIAPPMESYRGRTVYK